VSIEVGVSNLFIPGRAEYYATPSLITHYILAHGYCPPQPFLEAVDACPRMDSPEYYAALEAAGMRIPRFHKLRLPPAPSS